MPAVSKKQQRFFGMVRAAQKGEGIASPEVAKVADDISVKDAKKFAKTKHKGLPEKKKVKEETTEIHDSDGNLYATVIDIIKPTTMKVPEPSVRWQELTELNKKETKKLQKASILSTSDDPKDQERARARQTEVDYKDLLDQRKKGKVGVGKSMKEEITFKGWKEKAGAAMKRVAKKKNAPKHDYGKDAGAEAAKRLRKRDHAKVNFLDPDD